MEIYDRVKFLRKNHLGISQEVFANFIGLSRANIANIEKGRINLTDRVISDICRKFNVSEDWLRHGTGAILVEPDTFSLDEYAKINDLTSLEFNIIKGYMELDKDIRHTILDKLKSALTQNDEIAATKEPDSSQPFLVAEDKSQYRTK